MKKILALALCALMVLAMSAVAFAAEENAFEYNFEDDFEGDFIAIDKSIGITPATPTADIAIVLAAVSAIAASGVVVFKKRH